MLRDLFLYTVFMVSVILVAYGHMDVRSQFLQNQYVKHKFLKTPILTVDKSKGFKSSGVLEQVTSVDDMWAYLSDVVAPMFIKSTIVITTDYDIYLMGTARIRQVRAKNDSSICPSLPHALGKLLRYDGCSYSTSYFSEDTNNYNNTWDNMFNVSTDVMDDSPYIYQRSTRLIYVGTHGWYSGGGYVLPFGQDDLGAMKDAITKLHNSDWINEFTKCVFVEFTLYNAASDHFTNVIIAFEFTKFGAIYSTATIQSTRLFDDDRKGKLWLQLSEGFMVICVTFYAVTEILLLRQVGFKHYFLNAWSCLEVGTILLTCTVGVCFFLRYYQFVETLKNVQKYGHSRFLNFQKVFQMHEVLHTSLSLLGGVVIFKMLKVTAFNPFAVITFRSLKNGKASIYGVLLMTVILLCAFSITALLVFGRVLSSYRSINISMFTVLFFLMGESDYESLMEADVILGQMYFLIVTLVTQYCIVNFFCVILTEAFELTRYMAFRREKETVKYMVNRIKFYSGFAPKNVKRIKVM